MTENYNASAPSYGFDGFRDGLLHREMLRIRIQRAHKPFAESEPVKVSAGSLPTYETGMERHVYYEGDGRVPEDLLGAPR